jgi:hypothetical protein
MDAFFFITGDFLGGIFYDDPLVFEVLNAGLKVFFGPRQLKHHDSFFSGEYGGFQDIKCQVVMLG